MSRVPRLLSGHHDQSLSLSAPEAYLLSRVDAMLDEDDLALVTGMTPRQVAGALDRLAALGAVEMVAGQPPGGGPSQPPGPRSQGARSASAPPRYDPAELDEAVEIDLDRKRRVLDLFYRLDELTYYQLLKIDAHADKKQVKSAYYALAPEFHPDKFFRKQLGTYKQKIEAIFSRVTLAQDVLTSPDRRREYDEYLEQTQRNQAMSAVLEQPRRDDVEAILAAVEQAADRAVAEQQARPAEPARRPSGTLPAQIIPPSPSPSRTLSPDEVLRQRREALARKLSGGRRPPSVSSMPAVQPSADALREMEAAAERTAEAMRLRHEAALATARLAQVTRYLEAGRVALEQKDHAGAANSYRIAASLAPDDAAVQATCNGALRLAAAALADGYWKQALYEESQDRWAEAALSYSKVCAGRPDSAQAHERVAEATLRSSTNARRAVDFARKAVELDTRKPEYRVTLARAYLAAGLEKSALGELDRAVELAPKDAKVQALVGAVRSAFPRKEGK